MFGQVFLLSSPQPSISDGPVAYSGWPSWLRLDGSAALVPTPGTFDQQLLERGAGPNGFVSRRDSRARFHDRRTSFVLGEYASRVGKPM